MQKMTADPTTWGLRNAHDPTVVRDDDGTWYMFSTDAASTGPGFPSGVHVRTSPDLVEWSFLGTALDGVPGPAAEWSGAEGLWAPDVVRWPCADGALWHMYYSASTFGSRTSAIGLATATSLGGPWTDQGIVVATQHDSDDHNAIDAAIVFDRDGTPWMAYGSFFGGIYIAELSRETGLRVGPGPGTLIAKRPRSVDGAVEGAYIVYRAEEDRFVLFASYDSLADTYSVRVAAADHVTGPYLDHEGRSIAVVGTRAEAEAAGTKILGGHRLPGAAALIAPGHNSVFEHAGSSFMVHHVRLADDPRQHEAQIRRIHWTASGWPLVSPYVYAGAESEALAAPESVAGSWSALRFSPEDAGVRDVEAVHVDSDMRSDGTPVCATLRVSTATGSNILDGVVFGSWDPATAGPVLAFSGIDESGVVWWGTRVPQGGAFAR
ncbi:arabinan endo-1,5-alpha-L-arabinosidase [Microbacterium amylolyticum]|uniref:Arabinan endo-1,5-alpha-L-arabinosidase n=2 Tax=Microbacterium amylolyticum TaxID=936337 RepID=A0ABS4ZFC7_9MICO|nr:arabinan endo-1,5-alpha-L-arabinosidase [Microbacterium amylolyticum]MBP2435738.1 arabinan endo-1,5-alpha-L-arabinosidase [Microbacterium amylolyticum]